MPCSCSAQEELTPALLGSNVNPDVMESPTERYQGTPATGGWPATGTGTDIPSPRSAGAVSDADPSLDDELDAAAGGVVDDEVAMPPHAATATTMTVSIASIHMRRIISARS